MKISDDVANRMVIFMHLKMICTIVKYSLLAAT